MAPVLVKRRKEDGEIRRPKKKIKVRRQADYHSSSEDEEDEEYEGRPPQPETLPKSILKQGTRVTEAEAGGTRSSQENEDEAGVDDVERNTALNAALDGDSTDEDAAAEDPDAASLPDSEDDDDAESESETSSMISGNTGRAKKKRNDPDAFATSISKILDTKLTSSKRQDPVLSRSKSASDANKTLSDAKLEEKAKAQLRAEKKQALEKGRVRDVLGLETPEVATGALLEEEKKLKKTAQRGVVKLFNAVRAAQVKAEEGMRQARSEGVVGMQKREERVNEMSKQGFLDLISSGGRATSAV